MPLSPAPADRSLDLWRAGPIVRSRAPGRRTWLVVWVFTAAVFLVETRHLATSWHFFVLAGRVLSGPSALHLYALHPQLQFGPLTAAVSLALLRLGPASGAWAAAVLMAITGPVLLHLLVWGTGASRRQVLLGGLPFLLAWTELGAGAAHLDDALAMSLAVVAVRLLCARPATAAVLLALSADAKPWAVGFVVALLAVPAGRRLQSAFLWAAVVLVAWLPFVLADPRTVTALAHFTIANSPSSTLRFFGIETPRTPGWDRQTQLALGLVVGAVAVRRFGAVAALVAVLAARLLLEPGVHLYYCAGLLAATLAHDLLVARRGVPVLTFVAATFYCFPQAVRHWHEVDALASGSRALGCLLLLALLVVRVGDILTPGWIGGERRQRSASLLT